MGARWYDSALGRWLSADTIVQDRGDPQQLNRYFFVNNNPLRYRDPTGHAGWDTLVDYFQGCAYEFAANNSDALLIPATSPIREEAEALAVAKSDNVSFQIGRVIGGAANVAQGIIEIEGGMAVVGGGATEGVATAPTIVGAAAGVGVAVAGAVVVVHGGSVLVLGAKGVGEAGANLFAAVESQRSGGSHKLTKNGDWARKKLGLAKKQYNFAIHDIKKTVGDNPDMEFDYVTGDVYDQRSGELVGNLLDYRD